MTFSGLARRLCPLAFQLLASVALPENGFALLGEALLETYTRLQRHSPAEARLRAEAPLYALQSTGRFPARFIR